MDGICSMHRNNKKLILNRHVGMEMLMDRGGVV